MNLRRRSARGYTQTRYYCFDCGKSTARVQNGRRANTTGLVFVCLHGTGCNKGRTGSEVLDAPAVAK
jgi:hypothetical protein